MGIRYSYGEITSKNYHKLRYNPLDHGFIRNVFQNQTIQDLKISDHHFPYSSIYIYIYIHTASYIYFGFSARPLPCPMGTVSGEFDGSYNISETAGPGLAGLAWRGWAGGAGDGRLGTKMLIYGLGITYNYPLVN